MAGIGIAALAQARITDKSLQSNLVVSQSHDTYIQTRSSSSEDGRYVHSLDILTSSLLSVMSYTAALGLVFS